MLRSGILNPGVWSLISRVRHTNYLVIADRGFPFWPTVETVDLSLVDDVPTVLQVLHALHPVFNAGRAFMAKEFTQVNDGATVQSFQDALPDTSFTFEPHVAFKQRVPRSIGLIRTGDTIQYANIIVESA